METLAHEVVAVVVMVVSQAAVVEVRLTPLAKVLVDRQSGSQVIQLLEWVECQEHEAELA